MDKLKLITSVVLILITVFAAFLPSLKCGFINWDDYKYIVDNTAITSLSLTSLKTIFTSFFVVHYQPLTILSYSFDYQYYKLNPFGYHLTNLILHIFNCLLVFYFIFLLSKNIGASLITTIFFGIHPLRVESVVWISERKDVLYAFFYLSSMISYIYYLTKNNKLKYYFFSLFLFLCSLLSKSMAVTLPFVLLLLDYYLKRKPEKISFLNKVPYFCLSFIFSSIAILGSYLDNALRSESHYNFFSMLSVACYDIVFYITKLLFPLRLSCLYPYYSSEFNLVYLYSIIAVILLCVGLILSIRYTKKILFGGLFFVITLLPALYVELIVADRYSYISSIGIFFILASFLCWFYDKRRKLLVLLFVVVITTILSVITYNRSKVWHDGISLWSNALSTNSNSAKIYNNRGVAYSDLGKHNEAILDYKKALEIDPYNADSYNNLGVSLLNKKEYSQALAEFNKTLRINPHYSQAYYYIAMIYGILDNHQEAIKFCKKTIQIDPNNAKAYALLCSAYGNIGNFTEAVQAGKKAIEFDSSFASAQYNLSVAYYFNKQYDLACIHLRLAMKLGWKPDPGFLKEIEKYCLINAKL